MLMILGKTSWPISQQTFGTIVGLATSTLKCRSNALHGMHVPSQTS